MAHVWTVSTRPTSSTTAANTLLRRRSMRDQRRDPPQRRLFVGQPGEGSPALGVRDRGGEQLGERDEPFLHAVGYRATTGVDHHRAPDLAVHDDRGAGGRTEPGLATGGGDRAGDIGEVVDPRRTTGLPNLKQERRSVQRPARTGLERMRKLAPGSDHGRRRPVWVVAAHHHHRHADDVPDLPHDRGEHVRRRRPAGHQRRDPPQRVLARSQPGIRHGNLRAESLLSHTVASKSRYPGRSV